MQVRDDTSGRWLETADLEYDQTTLNPSLIYLEKSNRSNIDDFILAISFLTWRMVCTEETFPGHNPNNLFNNAVSDSLFSSADFDYNLLVWL